MHVYTCACVCVRGGEVCMCGGGQYACICVCVSEGGSMHACVCGGVHMEHFCIDQIGYLLRFVCEWCLFWSRCKTLYTFYMRLTNLETK